MRILYDLRASQPLLGNLHGGAIHALAVFEGLTGSVGAEQITAFHDGSRPIDPAAIDAARKLNAPLRDVRTDDALQGLLDSGSFDRLYSSLPYDYYRLDLSRIDVVMTIHGLRPLEMPADRHEWRYATGWRQTAKSLLKKAGLPLYARWHFRRFRRLLFAETRSSTFVVPSYHTKHALLSLFPELSLGSLHVAYSPLRAGGLVSAQPPDEARETLSALGTRDRRYFLLVNGGRWIKNAHRAIVALDRFYDAYPHSELDVVITGVKPGQKIARSPRHASRFRFHDYVSAPALQTLYSRAFALLYPTLNEGFGYPPIEAMRWGTPVIASSVASVPEVCAGAALYARPTSVEEWHNRISQLAMEPSLWREFSLKGPRRHREITALQQHGLTRICRLILQDENG